jgi:hypothetical protein
MFARADSGANIANSRHNENADLPKVINPISPPYSADKMRSIGSADPY